MAPDIVLPPRDESVGVLIVDDHEVVRRGCSHFSTASPISRSSARRAGGATLELLALMESEGRLPDVILMDLQMAPIDGSVHPPGSRSL